MMWILRIEPWLFCSKSNSSITKGNGCHKENSHPKMSIFLIFLKHFKKQLFTQKKKISHEEAGIRGRIKIILPLSFPLYNQKQGGGGRPKKIPLSMKIDSPRTQAKLYIKNIYIFAKCSEQCTRLRSDTKGGCSLLYILKGCSKVVNKNSCPGMVKHASPD